MATVKRIFGDYSITNKLVANANVTISTHTVIIDGNLVINGNSTAVNKINLSVANNYIVLNSVETGPGITLGTAGIIVDRGTKPNVGIRYNESVHSWQATNDGTIWNYIVLAANPGIALTKVQEDPNPKLGGNLNITGSTIYNTLANVTFYAKTPSAGGTGIFVDANGDNNQELITKIRSMIYTTLL